MTPIGYPVSYLHRDRERGLWRLDPAFDAATMAWHIVPGAQETELRNCHGALVTRGILTADVPVLLGGPGGAVVRLDRIEIDGVLSLYLAAEALVPGQAYPDVQPAPGSLRQASAEELAELPAFGPGTMIARPAQPAQQPVRIAAGTFGADMPARDTLFSPAVGVLLAGDELRMWFAEREMLARVDRLNPELPRAEGRETLYTLLLDQPEVIVADGMWVSSVEASNSYVELMPEGLRQALLPRLASGHDMPARRWMEEWEIGMFRRGRAAKRRHFAA